MIGAIIAFTSRAILRARATGAVISAPLLITPCGSSVPVGRMTVLIFEGTTSLNSIQLMSLISRVVTASGVWAAAKSPTAATRQREKITRNPRVITVLLRESFGLLRQTEVCRTSPRDYRPGDSWSAVPLVNVGSRVKRVVMPDESRTSSVVVNSQREPLLYQKHLS